MSAPQYPVVARRRGDAYFEAVIVLKLLRLLALVALVAAPIGMIGEHAAMAMPAVAAPAHAMEAAPGNHGCDGMDQPAKPQPAGIDCTIACTALPSVQSAPVPRALPAAFADAAAPVDRLHGLHPEHEPPPPRSA